MTKESIAKMNLSQVNKAILNQNWGKQFTMNLLLEHRDKLNKVI